MLLPVELFKLIGEQDPATERAYPDVHIAFLQKLPCFLEGGHRRVTAKIDSTELIDSADQVLRLCRATHA